MNNYKYSPRKVGRGDEYTHTGGRNAGGNAVFCRGWGQNWAFLVLYAHKTAQNAEVAETYKQTRIFTL